MYSDELIAIKYNRKTGRLVYTDGKRFDTCKLFFNSSTEAEAWLIEKQLPFRCTGNYKKGAAKMPQIQMFSLSVRQQGCWHVGVYPTLRAVSGAIDEMIEDSRTIDRDERFTVRAIREEIEDNDDMAHVFSDGTEIHIQEIGAHTVQQFLNYYQLKVREG